MSELVVELPDGPVTIPYVRVTGGSPGPHLTVVAGVHGTEYTSIAAAREFAQSLTPDSLSGTVTVMPIVNLPAFWARSPFVVPLDGKNLNRSFPGRADGTAAEILAHAVTENIITGSDYLLDLHAGDLPEALEPFALYDESPVADQARRLALAYGLGHVVRQSAAGRTVGGSTSATAADLGIAAITAESGQQGVLDRPSVERHLAGLANVLRSLQMTTGPVQVFTPVEHEGWVWLHTPTAGWWQPAIDVGQDVAAGDLLGTVSGILGEDPQEIRAPQAGVPLFLTASPAVLDDGLLLGLALTPG